MFSLILKVEKGHVILLFSSSLYNNTSNTLHMKLLENLSSGKYNLVTIQYFVYFHI